MNIPRDISRNPLFDTMLVMSKNNFSLRIDEAKAKAISFDWGISKLDLTLEVYEDGDNLSCRFEYNTRLFKAKTIQRMADNFINLTKEIFDNTEVCIKNINMLPENEYKLVTETFNRTEAAIDYSKTLNSHLEYYAAVSPDKTAVISDNKRLSFSELNKMADNIAGRLKELGAEPNRIVAFCLTRSVEMIAVIFGIMKTGAGYMPVDPALPKDRIDFMLRDSEALILITDKAFKKTENINYINIKALLQLENEGPLAYMEPSFNPDDIAYVIYTSGSTGVPKGAALNKKGYINLYESCKEGIAYNPDDICVSVTTVSFDIFVTDGIFPILYGCTTVISTEEELRQPHLLADLIINNNIKFMQTTPSRMRIMLSDKNFCDAAGNLNKIILAGEMIPESLLKTLRRYSGANIINGYGPTETTVYSSFKDLTGSKTVTIGRPVLNTKFYILDKYMRPVPVGVWGEAYISGAGTAVGYLNRPDLNKEKFMRDIFHHEYRMYRTGDICRFLDNGELDIAGRADHQIKIRGLRIELGEIESELRKITGVKDAVVHVLNEEQNKSLCAYYICDKDISEQFMREQLGKMLPSYMIPAFFVKMQEFPMTVSGKISKKELPLPKKEHNTNIKNQNHTAMTSQEKRMARIWSKILGVNVEDPYDNFFSLGGDSLAVIKTQAAIQPYGWHIRTQDFYDLQTLRAICGLINGATKEKKSDRGVKLFKSIPKTNDDAKFDFTSGIMLTGSTGFLGAHILNYIAGLGHTGKIFCLVRGENTEAITLKMKHILEFYFAGGADEIIRRIELVKGDISKPHLGMDTNTYSDLCSNIKTIIHCAAVTDHIGDKEKFEEININGTKNIISFAEASNASLIHISTISVSGENVTSSGGKQETYEFNEDCYYIGQNYNDNEYRRSKFVAEGLVIAAAKRGMKARVFRVGNLMGRYSDSKFQQYPDKNAFINRLRSIISMKAAAEGMLCAEFEMTPVDLCSKAIIDICRSGKASDMVYHISNNNVITGKMMISLLNKCGYKISVLNDSMFMNLIDNMREAGNLDIITGISGDLFDETKANNVTVSSKRTLNLLQELGFKWPELDQKYIGSLMRGMAQSKEEGA